MMKPTHVDSIAELVPEGQESVGQQFVIIRSDEGMTRLMQVKGVAIESHPSLDGDIELQPHKRAP